MADRHALDARPDREPPPADAPHPAADGGAGGWEAFDDPDAPLPPPTTPDTPTPPRPTTPAPDGGAGGWEAFDPDIAIEQRPVTEPYQNENPRATEDEQHIGRLLNDQLPETVSGAPEEPGRRSADYRFMTAEGEVRSADLYQPRSSSPENIADHVMDKSGQAGIVVIEFGAGHTRQMGLLEAEHITAYVHGTPGHSIERLIFVRGNSILLDSERGSDA